MIIRCELLSCWFFQAFKELINKVMEWKGQGNTASHNRFLIRLVFCNFIIVSWPSAFHLTRIISSFCSYRKAKLLKFFSTYNTTNDSEKNTLELIFPPVHHNLCFWQILLVSFCFPQISSSCPDMLAQQPVWKSYSWARRRLQSERCQYPHLFPYITSCWISNVSTLWYTVAHFTWPIALRTVVLPERHLTSWVYGPCYDDGLGHSAWGTPQTGATLWRRVCWR
jgi:hypothetical protein